MARAGAHVVLVARTQSHLEAVSETIRKAGGATTVARADVGESGDVDRLFTIAGRVGVPTALVCAAAVLHKSAIEATTPQTWEETLRINLTGTFLCCRAAFAPMRRAGGGRIVNLASLSGIYATEKFPGLAAYNVSKYGVVGLTEAIAVEGRPHNITAICISPGAVDTEMLRQANAQLKPGLTPAHVADLIVSLLNGAIAPASGANIPLFSNA
jgi:NAD(P)-dependent dehydrogenase (short-subunit alcohol dehydrogenase family)